MDTHQNVPSTPALKAFSISDSITAETKGQIPRGFFEESDITDMIDDTINPIDLWKIHVHTIGAIKPSRK